MSGAAAQNGDPRSEEEAHVQENEATIRHCAERLIRTGHRAVVMDVFNDIIKEFALDRFGHHRDFYHHYRGEAAE